MLSIQHVMSLMLANRNASSRLIAAAVYPDAIRAYTGNREYSHFEENANGTDISYMTFPYDMHMGKDDTLRLLQRNGYLAGNICKCAIGEQTHFETFLEHNEHLTGDMLKGISIHLKQDVLFDEFIRDQINCAYKYSDRFYFEGEELDGTDVRELITDIEHHGIYILAFLLYVAYGITANQSWLEMYIKPMLEAEYAPDLAEKTFSYMKIRPEIDDMITAHNWKKLGAGKISLSDYEHLYSSIKDEIMRIL